MLLLDLFEVYLSSVHDGVPSGSLQAKLRVHFSIIMPNATDCVRLARAVYVFDPLVLTI